MSWTCCHDIALDFCETTLTGKRRNNCPTMNNSLKAEQQILFPSKHLCQNYQTNNCGKREKKKKYIVTAIFTCLISNLKWMRGHKRMWLFSCNVKQCCHRSEFVDCHSSSQVSLSTQIMWLECKQWLYLFNVCKVNSVGFFSNYRVS